MQRPGNKVQSHYSFTDQYFQKARVPVMKRIVIVLVALLLSSMATIAAPATKFSEMSVKQIERYVSGTSVMTYERRYGTAIIYFSNRGKAYVYGKGGTEVLKLDWTVVASPKGTILCLTDDVKVRLQRGPKQRITFASCEELNHFFRTAVEMVKGDVMGLSKRSKPRFTLSGKTSFAKLQAGSR